MPFSRHMSAVASTHTSREQAINLYVALVSIVGAIIAASGIIALVNIPQPFSFILLTLLIIATALTSTSMAITTRVNITYQIDSAIALASVPVYGPSVAALLIAISSATLWAFKPGNREAWKKTQKQLYFNAGMMSIATAVAGSMFSLIQGLLLSNALLTNTLPWVAMAITFELTNILLLGGVLRLQNGPSFSFLELLKRSFSMNVLGIMINVMGAAFIAFALVEVGWVGVIAFFLPVLASAYAVRSYVKGIEAHMEGLEAMVNERTQALQQLNNEKSLFLAVLAHDMRSPLTSINLYGQMLQRSPKLAAEKPRILQSILNSQQHLQELVDNILDLEKLEAGNPLELEFEWFDLMEVLDLLADSMAAQASDKAIALTFNYEVEHLPMRGDRSQIRRVFANLLSNAIKYTPQYGGVTITAWQQEQHIVVSVQDTGYGIPADDLDTIFDRYSRVDKHRDKAAGTGLGLSISQAIVKAHAGEIVVQSQEEVGTTFTVELPISA